MELLIPTDQTTEQCTAQRPGCLRVALLVHRGARRVAHIDATLVDAVLKMMHRNMQADLIAAALTLCLETWKLPSWLAARRIAVLTGARRLHPIRASRLSRPGLAASTLIPIHQFRSDPA